MDNLHHHPVVYNHSVNLDFKSYLITSFSGLYGYESQLDFQTFLESVLINLLITLVLLGISLIFLQKYSFDSEKIQIIENEIRELHQEKLDRMSEK